MSMLDRNEEKPIVWRSLLYVPGNNEKFIANAPEEVIEENRERLAGAQQSRERLSEALARLQAA